MSCRICTFYTHKMFMKLCTLRRYKNYEEFWWVIFAYKKKNRRKPLNRQCSNYLKTLKPLILQLLLKFLLISFIFHHNQQENTRHKQQQTSFGLTWVIDSSKKCSNTFWCISCLFVWCACKNCEGTCGRFWTMLFADYGQLFIAEYKRNNNNNNNDVVGVV